MADLPRLHSISRHPKVDPGIILDDLAHRHLARSLAIAFASLAEAGMCRGGQLVAGSDLVHQLLDQRKVLEAKRNGKRGVVVTGENGRHVMAHNEAVGGAALHHVPPDQRVEAGELRRDHGLADCGRMDLPELVVDQLRDVAIAIAAHLAQLPHSFDDGVILPP